jgi:hypothetical protein
VLTPSADRPYSIGPWLPRRADSLRCSRVIVAARGAAPSNCLCGLVRWLGVLSGVWVGVRRRLPFMMDLKGRLAHYPQIMRIGMRRFTRLTNAFSKKLDNHIAAVAPGPGRGRPEARAAAYSNPSPRAPRSSAVRVTRATASLRSRCRYQRASWTTCRASGLGSRRSTARRSCWRCSWDCTTAKR